MEVLDVGLKIPAIIPPAIILMMVFLMKKVLKCLQMMEDLGIGILIPETLSLAIVELIIMVTVVEAYICLKRPSTLFLTIL